MSINTAIMSTAVARRPEANNNYWSIRTPLAGFIAQHRDRNSALDKFIEMMGAYMFAQERQSQASRARSGPGRPSKNYEKSLHIQVHESTKERFEAVAKEPDLSQSETIVFLLDSLDILRLDFVSMQEMEEAEKRVLGLAIAK